MKSFTGDGLTRKQHVCTCMMHAYIQDTLLHTCMHAWIHTDNTHSRHRHRHRQRHLKFDLDEELAIAAIRTSVDQAV
jgi:hypothetical protein